MSIRRPQATSPPSRNNEPDARSLGGIVRRTLETWRVPIFRSSYALILTTGSNAVLGLLFWIAAARLYTPGVVGLGAAGISALMLISLFGWVGLQFALMRYVPVAGPARIRLVAVFYAVAVGIALVAAVIFVVFVAQRFQVRYLTAGVGPSLVFVVSVAAWVIFSLQDAVLVGLRRATLVPIENALYGALKLALIVLLAGVQSPWSLFAVWAGSAAVLAVAVNALLFGRLLREPSSGAGLPPTRAVVRFATAHHGVAVIGAIPDYFVPLLVLRFLGKEANAHYYAAWTIAFSMRLVAVNLASALMVESAYALDKVWRLARTVTRLGVLILGPLVIVVLVAAEPLLSVFGEGYGSAAAGLLRWFSFALLPFTIITFVIAIDRVQERFGAALLVMCVAAVVTLGLDVFLIPSAGVAGAGIAWLVGQSLGAGVAVATLTRSTRQARVRQPVLDNQTAP